MSLRVHKVQRAFEKVHRNRSCVRYVSLTRSDDPVRKAESVGAFFPPGQRSLAVWTDVSDHLHTVLRS